MKRKPARLIIADDHRIVRSGLKALLSDQEQLEIVGEAASGREALELCRRLHPDLVLMDVRMPDMDGLTATREIKRQFSDIIVLILTTHENEDYVLQAIKSGAAGYLLKDASKDELVDAIRKALDGEPTLDPKLATKLVYRLAEQMQEPVPEPERAEPPEHAELVEPLTPRELEVLGLMALGYRNRAIAERLVITLGTTKNHVERIRGKLGVSDRTQAVVRALELGLVNVPRRYENARDGQRR
jgi:DNA-binding NarL/FixJ family response regulator